MVVDTSTNIRSLFMKLNNEDIDLRNKALILTALDRLMLEHPVKYCKAMNPKHYKTALNKMVDCGLITPAQIMNDQ